MCSFLCKAGTGRICGAVRRNLLPETRLGVPFDSAESASRVFQLNTLGKGKGARLLPYSYDLASNDAQSQLGEHGWQ